MQLFLEKKVNVKGFLESYIFLFERLPLHDVAPVARGVAHGQEDQLVLLLGILRFEQQILAKFLSISFFLVHSMKGVGVGPF